jgi:tetratricopeptide (TPR) repeat protein
MNTVEEYIEIAQQLQDKGEIEAAIRQFSKGFDLLIDQAGEYARAQEPETTDIEALRAVAPRLLAHSKVFLKQDITAAYILNAMGVLFGELKDYDNAQQKLLEAMEYIPDGTDFSDPADNLERIANEAMESVEEVPEEE